MISFDFLHSFLYDFVLLILLSLFLLIFFCKPFGLYSTFKAVKDRGKRPDPRICCFSSSRNTFSGSNHISSRETQELASSSLYLFILLVSCAFIFPFYILTHFRKEVFSTRISDTAAVSFVLWRIFVMYSIKMIPLCSRFLVFSFCLPVCLAFYLFVCLCLFASVCLSTYPFVSLSLIDCLFVYLIIYICLFALISQPVCLPI